MKTLSDYRKEARETLSGNWFISGLFVMAYAIINVALGYAQSLLVDINSLYSFLRPLIVILLIPMIYGIYLAFLGKFRDRAMKFGDLFSGYNKRVWLTMILEYIYTLLCFILLIVPGIIISYSYAMTCFLMVDDPNLSNNNALDKSMKMMRGYKWSLFKLDLSFIGWYLPGFACLFILISHFKEDLTNPIAIVLEFGLISVVWAEAYRRQAHAAFYETLRKEQQEII